MMSGNAISGTVLEPCPPAGRMLWTDGVASINARHDGSHICFAVSGELDEDNYRPAMSAIRTTIEHLDTSDRDWCHVIADLGSVYLLSAGALTGLLELRSWVNDRHASFALVSPRRIVVRVLTITGLDVLVGPGPWPGAETPAV
jgi:anti-anti-sigma factor